MTRGYKQDRDINGMTARERDAYRLALDGYTMSEIGAELGVNKSRAGQLVRSVIDKGFLTRNERGRIVPGPETPQ